MFVIKSQSVNAKSAHVVLYNDELMQNLPM